MKKPAWFDRELPRLWGGGKLLVDQVDQHIEAIKTTVGIILAVFVAWMFVAMVFCLSN